MGNRKSFLQQQKQPEKAYRKQKLKFHGFNIFQLKTLSSIKFCNLFSRFGKEISDKVQQFLQLCVWKSPAAKALANILIVRSRRSFNINLFIDARN